MMHPLISIVLSGLLCSLPFIEPIYLWPLIFVFPLPIFFNRTTITNNAFLHGYLWGLVNLSIQLSGINRALLTITHGSIGIRVIIPVLLVCIQAVIPGLLFFIGSKIIHHYSCGRRKRIAIQAAIFLLFFLYFEYAALWFTGTIEGYSLVNLIIPLMHLPFFRLILAHSNHLIMLGIIIGIPTVFAIGWNRQKSRLGLAFFCGIIFCTIYSIQFFNPKPQKPPLWISEIVALPFIFYVPHNMSFLMFAVAQELKKIVHKYPHTSLVIMPESSLYCSFLHLEDLTNLLSEKEVSKPLHFIAGSFSFSNNQYHNALYWIDNGKLKTCYYKRHTMFLTERIPFWLQKTFVEKIFFSQSPIIVQSTNKRPLLEINDEIKLVPYICSELFFNHQPDDTFEKYPILAISNDRNFLPYIADLMVNHAQRIAITWNRPIIYVSFLHHVYIDTSGALFPLKV
jgi:hypothetical protein